MKKSIFPILSLWMMITGAPNSVRAQANRPSPFALKSVTPAKDLTAAFHQDKRFAGADGACSVPIDEVNTLWFFGDTFVRKNPIKQVAPVAAAKDDASMFTFINNSGAMQNVQTKKMQFFWRGAEATPESLLKPGVGSEGILSSKSKPGVGSKSKPGVGSKREPRLGSKSDLGLGSKPALESQQKTEALDKSYYWPGDGFFLDEKLFLINKVVVPHVVSTKKHDPNGFNFEWRSDDLLQISDCGEEPANWHWKSAALPDKLKVVLIGTACYVQEEFAYFYTSVQKDAKGLNVHPTGVSRIPVRDLLAMDMTKFTFWNGGKWVPNIAESKVIIEDGAPEMTVTKLGGEPYLVATYMPPLSADIKMRFSKKPEGPWSDAITVFQCPEHNIEVLGQKCSVYSAKAHPEFSDQHNELIVSYCSNPGEMKHYLSRPDLYYPRIIKVELAPNSTRSEP